MRQPRILDLFCGSGGAGYGYSLAGFDVVGVDLEPKPHYPFLFVRGDAIEVGTWLLDHVEFDAIHASPPCNEFTQLRRCRPHAKPKWVNMIPETRELLQGSGLPYIIENVPFAPLRNPVQLCGTSFGRPLRRHRWFESNVKLVAMACEHQRFTERKFPGSSNRPNGRTVCNIGEYRVPLATQLEVMGITWEMTLPELSQAIPPCYTEHLGGQLLRPSVML